MSADQNKTPILRLRIFGILLILQNEQLRAEHKRLKQAMEQIIVRLNELVHNSGLKHIALQIFNELDPKSHGNCRLVSKEWKNCIDNDKLWWQKQLANDVDLLGRLNVDNYEFIEKFIKALDQYVYKNEQLNNLKLFTIFTREYCKKLIEDEDLIHYRYTPLHFAAEKNNVQVIKLFLDHAEDLNIDLNVRNQDQRTPLMYAKSKNVLELLLRDDRIDAAAIDNIGYTVLHFVCDYNGSGCSQEEIANTITLLLQSSQIPFIKDETPDEFTPLHLALEINNDFRKVEAILRLALKYNIDVNVEDHYGRTPAHIAFENGFIIQRNIRKQNRIKDLSPQIDVILKYAKKIGINLEATDNSGRTPLHFLCENLRCLRVRHFLQLAKSEYQIEFNLKAVDLNRKNPMDLCRK